MKKLEISNMWNGYCPESSLKGKTVRMRLNQSDFFESEETGLQICILSGVQAIIMNFRGKGKFRSTPNYADEIENGEILSPQNTTRPPFNSPTVAFENSSEIDKYINSIEPWTNEQKRLSTLSNATSGIIDLSKLHELIRRSKSYKILDTKSMEGKEYKALTNEIMNSVPEKPGFYLWGKFNDKKFWTLFQLADEGLDFRLVVLGEAYQKTPPIFAQAKEKLADRILHFGFAEDFGSYAKWLWKIDLLPVTSRQDFFGGSVVEAIFCDCWPLLPRRLAYPEHLPAQLHGVHFYESENDLLPKMRQALLDVQRLRRFEGGQYVGRYDWGEVAGEYDGKLAAVLCPAIGS